MEKLREYRQRIFTILLLVKTLPKSRELSLVITCLERARMFTGKVLQELWPAPENNPYPESDNPSNSIVEKTADAEDLNIEFKTEGYITQLKELRVMIDELTKELKDYYKSSVNFNDFWGSEYYMTVVLALVEAKMWVGTEMGNNRNLSSSSLSSNKIPGVDPELDAHFKRRKSLTDGPPNVAGTGDIQEFIDEGVREAKKK